MQEYLTDAVVLNKIPNGDLDTRYVLFTRRFGKLTAKAKSARKITSKLAPHLEPGTLSAVRLIEKNGLQVVDALKKESLVLPIRELHLLGEVLAEAEPEKGIWASLTNGKLRWPEILKVLGWDPGQAQCAMCGTATPEYFDYRSQDFFCADCLKDKKFIGRFILIY